ncbi:MAG: hypothetical protein JNK38_27125 [Acidobacteria bacterium]|nr:hypothetical protein [Acidobacteriota bacterium]
MLETGALESARWLPLAVALAVGVFYLLTIRTGHEWGDDFSLYLMHARNLAGGLEYRPAEYLHYSPYIGPDAYPPVFPLLLAPVYWLFGLNLTAMKVVVIVTFVVSLLVFGQMLKEKMSPIWQAGLIAVAGFCPYLWDKKDRLTSDLVFLVFAYLGILLVNKSYRTEQAERTDKWDGNRLKLALATGVVFYLAYGTRSLGLLLVPCLLLFDLVHRRKWLPSRFASVVTAVTGILVLLQSRLLHSDRGYYDQLATSFHDSAGAWLQYIRGNVFGYGMALTEIWDNGYHRPGRLALATTMTVLMLVGYLARVRKKLNYLELFVAVYLVTVSVVPMDGGGRYLIPLVPLFVLYAWEGLQVIPVGNRVRNAVVVMLGIAILGSYVAKYTRLDLKTFPDGITKAEAVEFFDYVKQRTRPSDVFIFTKPRALALFTDRKSSFYPVHLNDKGLWDYFQRIKATHIVLGPKGISPEEQEFLTTFVGKYSTSLRREFANDDFVSYRILGIPQASGRTNYKRTRLTDPLPQE